MIRQSILLFLGTAALGAADFSPEQLTLSAEARGIFAHHCTKCHGQQKQKGELRLDTKEYALKGGEDGVVLVPEKAAESEIIKRVMLPKGHDDAMPPKGGPLEVGDIETLRKWIAAGAPWPEGETAGIVFQRASLAPRKPRFPDGSEKIKNPVDKFVAAYFRDQKMTSPPRIDDRAFLRRVSLDSIGLLPTWGEVKAFKGDREAAVDALLARRDDYAVHWMSFWNDSLRNDYSGTGYLTGGRRQISEWLYAALRDDMPYDQFVRELIAPHPASEGFITGIRWRGDVSAGQRNELQAAQGVAQVFLGLNLKCASCHDSFINDYKLKDAHALAAVFADKPLAVFRCDKPTGEETAAGFFWPELGSIDPQKSRAERQQQLAALLTKKENGRLARTLVNRLWAACFGRGLVESVDVMDNKPWSQDLLDWLAWDFAENGWNVKHTLRVILTSITYQLPGVAVPEPDALTKSSFVFKGPVVRRLSAEEFADAVGRVAAPLYTKRIFNPTARNASLAGKAQWIWHEEKDRKGITFPEGKRYFRAKFTLPEKSIVRSARVVATADDEFTLHMDGQRVLSGTAWQTAESTDITKRVTGRRQVVLAVEATNRSSGPAGLRLAIAVWFVNEKAPLIVLSNANWLTSAEAPAGWEQSKFDDSKWAKPAVLGADVPPWGLINNFVLVESQTSQPGQPDPLVRAALVENDAFQNILGRPIRDQVNMSRPTATTLLQALTFANGHTFTDAIERAAKDWSTRSPDANARLDAIYHAVLLREPRADERTFANAAPADLLWSLVLTPEFQLIR